MDNDIEFLGKPVGFWIALGQERDALRKEVDRLGNGIGDMILDNMKLQRKLDIAVRVLKDIVEYDEYNSSPDAIYALKQLEEE